MEKLRNSSGWSSSTEVLDVKPLRSLAPLFPTPSGNTTVSPPGVPPFICISPFPLASGIQPGQSPSSASAAQPSNNETTNAAWKPSEIGNNCSTLSPGKSPRRDETPSTFPSFSSPPHMFVPPLNEDVGIPGSVTPSTGKNVMQMEPYSNSNVDALEGGTSKSKRKRKRAIKANKIEPMALPSSPEDSREMVEVILMTFDALRRRLANKGEKQSAMKAGITMTDFDLRANKPKRVGCVPGIEVGDIFYFRIEMYLVGLHAQSMAGIDTMATKFGEEDDTIAVSVVSSGGYEDETDLVDSLIYTGQGGKVSEKKQADDQKLERGNLALERSLHRRNEIRVIRGMKDPNNQNGKVFVYDGLYKIGDSWVEKGKAGFNVFKYKLLRQPGQLDAFATWKTTEKWKGNPSARSYVILPDMSNGEETIPVCLVNEVDLEKGPAPFSYSRKVKYSVPISSSLFLRACSCQNACLPGDCSCSCTLQNGGNLPYTSECLLVSRKPMIYECSSSCWCSGRCRTRLTQKGIKLRFEVFRTRDRGWGLRSWDHIRAGSFICEYVGEIKDKVNIEDEGEDEFMFEASYSDEKAFQWNYGPELLGESSSANSESMSGTLSIIISAKQVGNVARFMNHSCSPNVFWQPVQHDHGDERYPHIMFFAFKHIPPMTELTYDYGPNNRKQKKCLCQSTKCRGFFN